MKDQSKTEALNQYEQRVLEAMQERLFDWFFRWREKAGPLDDPDPEPFVKFTLYQDGYDDRSERILSAHVEESISEVL